MSSLLNSIYLFLGVSFTFAELLMLLREFIFYDNFCKNLQRKYKAYLPKTSLIVPCKGIDASFEDNIDALLNQSYPHYKVIFVVDNEGDPAYSKLLKFKKNKSYAKIAINKSRYNCSGKVGALIKGVDETEKDVEVLAFADSDIRPHLDWLHNLIEPLRNHQIAVSTGYRWYIPGKNIWSIVCSIWNAIGLSVLQSKYIFVWGGSFAIRKEIFKKLKIRDKWKTAISDDLTLTKQLKKTSYRIIFIPRCLVGSFHDCNLSQFLNWSTRQMKMIRYYYHEFWKVHTLYGMFRSGIITLGIILCLHSMFTGKVVHIAGVLMLCPAFIVICRILILIFEAQKVFEIQRNQIFKYQLWYAITSLLIHWIFIYNFIRSTFENKVEWRNVTYKLKAIS